VAERVRLVLIDLGGVLETGCWPGIAEAWAPRLGITSRQMLAAVFGGSDSTVLVGRMSEDDWWQQVRHRLGAEPGSALFIDDTSGHVAAAEALGMAGHPPTGARMTVAAAIESFLSTGSAGRRTGSGIESGGTLLAGG